MELPDLLGRRPPPSSQWSIAAVDVASGAQLFGHQEAQLLRTASVGKVFVLVELAAAVAAGDVSLRQPVARGDTDPVLDSGLWHTMLADVLPAGDVARLVGAVSDNWATNALIDLVGLDAVRERARQLAPGGSALHDYVRDERLPGMPPTLSEGCAADWVSICARLERSELVGPEADAMVRDWLGREWTTPWCCRPCPWTRSCTPTSPTRSRSGTRPAPSTASGPTSAWSGGAPARSRTPSCATGTPLRRPCRRSCPVCGRSVGAIGAVLDQNENVF